MKSKSIGRRLASILLSFGALALPRKAVATEYHFCVICDNYRAHAVAKSGPADLGREWYRVSVARTYASAHGSQGCGANDFDFSTCGGLQPEELNYYAASSDQLRDFASGDPVRMGQSVVGGATGAVGGVVDGAKRLLGW